MAMFDTTRRLRCSVCGTMNSEERNNWPIWVRGYSRQVSCPPGPLPRPSGISHPDGREKPKPVPYTHEAQAPAEGKAWYQRKDGQAGRVQ
jgi:hypothetical protein